MMLNSGVNALLGRSLPSVPENMTLPIFPLDMGYLLEDWDYTMGQRNLEHLSFPYQQETQNDKSKS